MLKFLFFLFIALPLLELYVLIEVGSGIGGLSTIALCLLTAALGGLIIRLQGLITLIDARKRFSHGELPAEHGVHGLILAVSGLLLFTPGFITDSLGFLLLIPAIRRLIIRRIFTYSPVDSHPQHGETIIEAEIIHDKHIR